MPRCHGCTYQEGPFFKVGKKGGRRRRKHYVNSRVSTISLSPRRSYILSSSIIILVKYSQNLGVRKKEVKTWKFCSYDRQ